jgi:hypothetical protein
MLSLLQNPVDLKGMVHTPELAPVVTNFTQDGSGFWNLLGYEPCHIIQYLAIEDTAELAPRCFILLPQIRWVHFCAVKLLRNFPNCLFGFLRGPG